MFEIDGNQLLIDKKVFPLEGYSFIKCLDSGANAITFLTQNNRLNRKEVVKIWIPRQGMLLVDPKRVALELNKNAKFIGNKNICTVFSASELDGLSYCTMEYIDGIELRKWLAGKHEYMLRFIVLKQILIAMIPVYEEDIYHGDLHSRNIIVTDDNVAKIIDFGTSAFSGSLKSNERDCCLLYNVAFEVMPELKKVSFLCEKVKSEGSLILANLLLDSMTLSLTLETHMDILSKDQYEKNLFALRLARIKSDFPFLTAYESKILDLVKSLNLEQEYSQAYNMYK